MSIDITWIKKMNQNQRIHPDRIEKIRHLKWESGKNARPEMYYEDIWYERYSSVF